jgi:hypothetical protein
MVVLVAAGLISYGAWRSQSRSKEVTARLEATQGAAAGATVFHAAELEGLPEPVRRYFAAVLSEGQPLITRARLVQRGAFRVAEGANGWRPFTATEQFVPRPPGYAWLARVRMAPGLGIDVRDMYITGAGAMRAEALGLIVVADAHDTPEIAASALQRYLAEGPWLPTALLPSQGVAWTALDDSTARATLTDHATTVSIDFRFAPSGEITSAFTAARYRAVKDGFERTPWGGRFSEYADHDGMRLPTEAEVAWVLDGTPEPYWRGRVIEVDYEFSR